MAKGKKGKGFADLDAAHAWAGKSCSRTTSSIVTVVFVISAPRSAKPEKIKPFWPLALRFTPRRVTANLGVRAAIRKTGLTSAQLLSTPSVIQYGSAFDGGRYTASRKGSARKLQTHGVEIIYTLC